MEIIKEVNGTELTFRITGRIDTHTSQQLEAEINDNVAGMTKLLFDMSGVTYVAGHSWSNPSEKESSRGRIASRRNW